MQSMEHGSDNRQESGDYRQAVASLISTFELNKAFFAAQIPGLYQQLRNEVRYCRRLLHAGKQARARMQLQEDLFRLFGVRVYVPCDRQLSVLASVIRHVLVAGANIRGPIAERGGVRLLVSDVCRQASLVASGSEGLLVLDAKLTELTDCFPEWACLLELRYFARLGLRDIAAELGVEVATIKRDMRLAKAWLMIGLRSVG